MGTLIDRFGRHIDYLRLSVTDRCDLRCQYCMPEGFKGFEEPAHWLTFDEIERLVSIFAQLGISRVRLTGGEPLLRKGLPELAARLAKLPELHDISLSTNGTQLVKHGAALRSAGVQRLNVSLDTLQAERFHQICGRPVFDDVLAGLAHARQLGFDPIKINMVAMKGVNDDEIDDMVSFCMDQGFVLRLIETMPVGQTGRDAQFLDLQAELDRIQHRFGLLDQIQLVGAGPARYLSTVDGRFSVGFITPISQHFCASCNRIRMTVDGTLHLCLGQEAQVEFRPLLRSEASDSEIVAAIHQAIELKPERHEFREQPSKIMRFMSMTGG
ncbi:GTP 3',8-cyclase MoaA [Telluria mixta]|uniref:GTP 3',8-cyclase n=1 Tax=Telluria mixta TaxID=34071 RepID=A0ABT2BS39_9BURK|nr:GTP 3',8-cyclase MoaA [Telluria mixta]MCS0627937.1 GTP 3',8-cyclase MoaA [Telluria mixta]WEM93944.1 GTP 3',8-cyclase MoaA [Telluria mixta]